MKMQMRDEQRFIEELRKKKMKMKKDIGKQLIMNSRPFRGRMKELNKEANEERRELERKYVKKLNHLRDKYREEEEEREK